MKKLYRWTVVFAVIGLLAGCDVADQSASTAGNGNSVEKKSVGTPGTENEMPRDDQTEASEDDASSPEAHSQDGGYPPATTALKEAGWYMRTVVTATLPDGTHFTHNTAGVFGELDESSQRRDRHDIESFGKASLQVRFVNNRVHIAKEYFSDYRAFTNSSEKQVWTFLVKNEVAPDLSEASLQIDVAPLVKVFKKQGSRLYEERVSDDQSKRDGLMLVDVDNRQVYSYDELKNIVLSMDGKHVRTFRWVLNGNVSDEDMAPRKVIETTKTQGAVFSNRGVSAEGGSKFGLPPL